MHTYNVSTVVISFIFLYYFKDLFVLSKGLYDLVIHRTLFGWVGISTRTGGDSRCMDTE